MSDEILAYPSTRKIEGVTSLAKPLFTKVIHIRTIYGQQSLVCNLGPRSGLGTTKDSGTAEVLWTAFKLGLGGVSTGSLQLPSGDSPFFETGSELQ